MALAWLWLGLAQAMALTSKILISIIYYHIITYYDYLLSKLEKEATRRGILLIRLQGMGRGGANLPCEMCLPIFISSPHLHCLVFLSA
jgi:hypothetical protein